MIASPAVPSIPRTPSALLRFQRTFGSPGAELWLTPPPRGAGCRFHSRFASFWPLVVLRNKLTKDTFPYILIAIFRLRIGTHLPLWDVKTTEISRFPMELL